MSVPDHFGLHRKPDPEGEEALYIQDTARQMKAQLGKDGAIRRLTKILAQDRTVAPPEFWAAVLKKLSAS